MKKLICISLIILFAACSAACAVKDNGTKPTSYEMLSFVAPAASPFERKWYRYVDTSDGSNPTQYLIPHKDELGRYSQGIDELNLKESEEAVDCLITKTGGGLKYTIEGTDYYPLAGMEPKQAVSLEEFQWSVDRRFFYKYAETKQGATLYRSLNCNTDEVIIFVQNRSHGSAEDVILAKEGSVLLDAGSYDISDFGIAVINDHSFVNAAFFEKQFAAHTKKTDDKQVDEDYWLDKTDRHTRLVFEYVRIPGLRYTMWMTESDQEPAVFVYSRAVNGIVCIESGSGLPYDKIE